MNIKELEPNALWSHFADLNAVPRPSKKEERVRAFMVEFGKNLQLETIVDTIGNVIIKKNASAGMENRKTIILQAHLDMVHQKNSDTTFDFDNQGIDMIIEGDWVKAKGTTLGADNGIGVAAIMAILSSSTIPHPPIEAFFTIDEETGMTGAMKMDGSLFKGEILLNIDTEDDDELSIGCAGGIDTNTSFSYSEESIKANSTFLEISIRGLLGGHSGMDIDKGRGNANKWMSRILWEINRKVAIQLISFDGGSLRNAIPREATAVIAIESINIKDFTTQFNELVSAFQEEYKSIEHALNIDVKEINSYVKAMSENDFKKISNLLCSL
ncbi:MAG: beta-Ala-His dipeptidase, partial [Crocinitomicaceae bacterium]